ncbi:dihydroorotate dehydrogenase [Bacillus sp. FJAT-18017]|uniref:ZIP family metal transporter n=1 Tax=Bacillus sp. FJAT-18017 TaxID=1705566 RepID=UPI0006B04F33|nr:ZIP family metal transporter [Bacillus sp. FJAT-18017]ALC90427.1 dihydroorotate dehydrogenase [Bacillus sp. FJAT-18017]
MESVYIGSLISALATGVGALPILFVKGISNKFRYNLLALASGIMLAASAFSLIPEALKASNLWILGFGLLAGTFLLNLLDQFFCKLDFDNSRLNITISKSTFVVLCAMTVHNIPEGLSVGVSYGSDNASLGGLIAFAIGLQNAPEGFLVALYLIKEKISKWWALLIATGTGLVEFLSSLIGYGLASKIDGIVPFGLSIAAGAMLFIIYKELIPESQEGESVRFPTYSFIIGLILMLFMVENLG